ncbi:uncharacterized protein METZ01_LOCUS16762 [marine metagenome]|uniref:Uncharacterized protein n=1 Tax=marine metagenome TaxID=408172 RepID=A0A381PC92_9ZZZZ
MLNTSTLSVSVSPGRTGEGQVISEIPAAPWLESPKKPSVSNLIIKEPVCQPDAIRLP